jgi:hypothetical protein
MNNQSLKPYSPELVLKLTKGGYKYFSIMGYALDGKQTYMEAKYILLTPIKELANELAAGTESNRTGLVVVF